MLIMDIEQRMHYQMQLEDALKKKKKALVAVCTLGLSETPVAMLFKDSEDTKKQMSFGGTPAGWIFQAVWFVLWTLITMTIFWIINVFKLINYAVFAHRIKKVLASD